MTAHAGATVELRSAVLRHGDSNMAQRAREVDTEDTHREDSTVAHGRVRRHAPVSGGLGYVRRSGPLVAGRSG